MLKISAYSRIKAFRKGDSTIVTSIENPLESSEVLKTSEDSYSKTLDHAIESEDEFVQTAVALMTNELLDEEGIRLIGVGISNFKKEEIPPPISQLTLEF